MAIGSIGQEGALSNQVQRFAEIKENQQQAALTPETRPGQPANIDRVDITPLAKQNPTATPPTEKPQMFKLFSEEIEAAIGRIENIISGGKNVPTTGSMMSYQKTDVVNSPSKGVMGFNQEQMAENTQKVEAEKAQAKSAQSIVSPSQGSLKAIVERVGSEQLNRNAQGQAAAQLAV